MRPAAVPREMKGVSMRKRLARLAGIVGLSAAAAGPGVAAPADQPAAGAPVPAVTASGSPASAPGDNCAAIVARIDAKLRAGGVVNYTLGTAELDAVVTERVIGSCGNGRRKIVYASVGPQAPGAAAVVTSTVPGASDGRAGRVHTSTPARPPAPDAILTECREGWSGPDCRERVPGPPATPGS